MIRHDGTQAKAKERTHTGKEKEEEASHSTTPQLTSLPPSLPHSLERRRGGGGSSDSFVWSWSVRPSWGKRANVTKTLLSSLFLPVPPAPLPKGGKGGGGPYQTKLPFLQLLELFILSLSLFSSTLSPPPLCVVPARQWWDGGGRFLEVIIRPHRVNCCCPKGGKNGV